MFGLKQLYDWTRKQVHKPYALAILILAFCAESCILIIPVDPLLILFCLEDRAKSWFYAFVATASSVFGGLIGYAIGFGIWQTVGQSLVQWLFSPEQFQTALNYFKNYEAAAVLVAAFTPIPYKLVTISAGFCTLPLMPFIIYSIIGRGLRFYLVAGIMKFWGETIKEYIDRYFNMFVLLFTALIVVTFRFII